MVKPVFFETPQKLNAWLKKNGQTKDELLVGYYKKGTGKPSVTWEESVDEALCFGWIDGIRRKIDDESYSIRFTPRRPNSTWSKRNIERVAVLTRQKRMRRAGVKAFENRTAEKSARYSYEQQEVTLGASFEKTFKANQKAWQFFESLAESYKKPSIGWVVSAKKEETQLRRLEKLIQCSASGQVLPQFLRPATRKKKKKPIRKR